MNKTKARIAKGAAAILVTALLFWNLARQIRSEAATGAGFSLWPGNTIAYFIAAVLLLPINVSIEARKWQLLVSTAMPLSFIQAMHSVLAGIAASLVTPNRIGEYPGRILAMRRVRSTRLISISVLGACSQMLSLMFAGIAGLSCYCFLHPKLLYWLILCITVAFTAGLSVLYFSFERWAPHIERIRWLRRLRLWGRLLHRFSRREQVVILAISMSRFAVFTVQFWLLLRWQGIPVPLMQGLAECALFFWALAIIPTIALAELGVRGTVAVYLFGHYDTSPGTPHTIGIATAVFILWCINLLLPALPGIYLFFRGTGSSVKPVADRSAVLAKE